MQTNDFKIGDTICHISAPSIPWVIEDINDGEIFCSTLIKETREQKKETFMISVIKKYESPKIIMSSTKRRSNHY